MARQLALLLWFASVLPLAHASESSATGPSELSQKDLGNPKAVETWLKENGAKAHKADKKNSQRAYEYGQLKKQRKEWGAAAKAFGESALFYPTPKALNEYADNWLRMLGEIRQREKTYGERWQADLSEAEATYRTALAADSVLKLMTDKERQQTRKNAECLADYIKSQVKQGDCLPLQLYGVKK
ncbi:hypothetical protein OOT46_03860 [Aquabacterium sp. A7-Y]|uniref:hypothetical protein n=1 Tax=Aquabacterium sp. A7-Y TaxID=1349605 RepID=UPI00223D2978|nr:hypothetical protein [Aquabacterium sp. A7-Y]MCW7536989.1 hypothetical protein [Aquabacterium sp. A7-Y]